MWIWSFHLGRVVSAVDFLVQIEDTLVNIHLMQRTIHLELLAVGCHVMLRSDECSGP